MKLLATLALFSATTLSVNAYEPDIDFDTEELYLIKANGVSVNDGISLFVLDNDFYTPITPFLSALGVKFTRTESTTSGWIFSKTNTFSYEHINKKGTSFIYEDTTYVNITKFTNDFGIDIYNHTLDAELQLTTENKFAFELKDKSKRKINQKKQRVTHDIANQYNVLNKPSIGIDINVNTNQATTSKTANFRYNGDILNHSLELFAHHSDTDSNIPLLTFSKILDINHTGIISSYQVGDITTNSNHYLTSNFRGRGIALYKRDETENDYFNAKIINGYHAPNYTVELFQNDVLIDTTTTNELGYYEFKDNPLFYGQNKYHIIITGEYGDTYEKDIEYKITGDLLRRGENNHSLYIVDTGHSATGIKQSDDGLVINGEYSYGVTDTLAYSVGLSHVDEHDDDTNTKSYETYITNSLTFTTAATINTLELINSTTSWGTTLRSNGFLHGLSYNILLSEFGKDFEFNNHQQTNTQNLTISRSTGSIGDIFLNNTIFVGYNRNSQEDSDETSTRLGLTTRVNAITLRHTIEDNNNGLTHNFNANTTRWGARLNYKYTTNKSETKHSLEATKRLFGATTSLKYERLTSNKANIFTFNINKQFNAFNLRGFAKYSDSNYEIGLNLSTNIFFTDKPNYTRFSLQNNGNIEAHAFIDENYNNQFDKGEKGVEGVQFESNRLWRTLATGKDGKIHLPGVRHLKNTPVKIKADSVEDFTLNIPEEIIVMAHKGGTTRVEFPLKKMKTVEFTLYDENNKALKYIPFTITSSLQTIKGYTDEDGYYFNETLYPGTFTLRLTNNPNTSTTFEIENNDNADDYYFDKLTVYQHNNRSPH